MEQHEIETLRDKVPCAAVLEREGWTVDVKESTARAVKYRRGEGEIIIVIHGGRGWFDPLSDAKGDVFTLAGYLAGIAFPVAVEAVRGLVGYHPATPSWNRPKRTTLYRLDTEKRDLIPVLDFPSAGDTAFPGIVRTGAHTLLIANYTSPLDDLDLSWVNGQTSPKGTQIYLTTLTFTPKK